MHATTSDFIRLAPANFPSDWHEQIERVLTNHEQIIAWLETDLDQQLYFSSGLIVLTNRRILAGSVKDEHWNTWHYQQDMKLTCQEHAGICSIELSDTNARLARWHCTLGKQQTIDQLTAGFARLINTMDARTTLSAKRQPGKLTVSKIPLATKMNPRMFRIPKYPRSAFHLGIIAPVALCQTLQMAITYRLHADAGQHSRRPGTTLPDHATDG